MTWYTMSEFEANLRSVSGLPVVFKYVHTQFPSPNKVSLTKLDKSTSRGDTFPGGMKQFARQGIQDYINATAGSFVHQCRKERGVAGVEYMFSRDPKFCK